MKCDSVSESKGQLVALMLRKKIQSICEAERIMACPWIFLYSQNSLWSFPVIAPLFSDTPTNRMEDDELQTNH